MKKIISLLMVCAILSIFAGQSFAGDTTPIKISLLPGVSLPASENVTGIDLGILGTKSTDVTGVQLSWFYNRIEGVLKGIQFSLVCSAEEGTGIQYSVVSLSNDFKGIQMGIYNRANNMAGLQWGLVNVCDTMQGVQFGLVNIIKESKFLPVMVILNASF
jgi:hypothetical protein